MTVAGVLPVRDYLTASVAWLEALGFMGSLLCGVGYFLAGMVMLPFSLSAY